MEAQDLENLWKLFLIVCAKLKLQPTIYIVLRMSAVKVAQGKFVDRLCAVRVCEMAFVVHDMMMYVLYGWFR